MSLIRSFWNNGQSLNTPDMQRSSDIASYSDDRVYEVLLTPGATQKRIVPLVNETISANPQLLLIPSATNGRVSVQPCHFVAGTSGNSQAITYSATLISAIDAPAIASNSSGSNRYDLIYATVNRTVPNSIASPPANTAYAGTGLADTSSLATASRKTKSVTDGTISTTPLTIYDSPTITLSVNAGFLTGATAPTAGQIAAATPADTTNPNAFNFALAYITVANGYTAGSAIAQTAITPTWARSFVHGPRVRSIKPGSVFGSGIAEADTSLSSSSVLRWGAAHRFFFAVKLKTGTPTSNLANGTNPVLDNSIDWRGRVIWGWFGGLAGHAGNNPFTSYVAANISPDGLVGSPEFRAAWTSVGGLGGGSSSKMEFDYVTGGRAIGLAVETSPFATAGSLTFYRVGTPLDGTNGDIVIGEVIASDVLDPNF